MLDNNFYMSNRIHEKNLFNPNILNKLKVSIQPDIQLNKSFAKAVHLDNNDAKIVVFLPLLDTKKENVGYVLSIREDDSVH